jgi:hypothetical protein
VQDANAEKNNYDLLEQALKDPVHAKEPAMVKCMVAYSVVVAII